MLGQKVYFKLNWQHIGCTPLENILLSLQLLSLTNKLYINVEDKSFNQIVYNIMYVLFCGAIFMINNKKKKAKRL